MSDSPVQGSVPSDPYAARDLVADGVEAVERAVADQERKRRTFTHGGEVFELKEVADLKVMIAMTRGHLARALELALVGGMADVDRLLATDEPLSEPQLDSMLTGWLEAQGTSQGESSASSRS